MNKPSARFAALNSDNSLAHPPASTRDGRPFNTQGAGRSLKSMHIPEYLLQWQLQYLTMGPTGACYSWASGPPVTSGPLSLPIDIDRDGRSFCTQWNARSLKLSRQSADYSSFCTQWRLVVLLCPVDHTICAAVSLPVLR